MIPPVSDKNHMLRGALRQERGSNYSSVGAAVGASAFSKKPFFPD